MSLISTAKLDDTAEREEDIVAGGFSTVESWKEVSIRHHAIGGKNEQRRIHFNSFYWNPRRHHLVLGMCVKSGVIIRANAAGGK